MFGLTINLKFPRITLPKRLSLFRKNEIMTATKEKTEKRETCTVPAVGQSQQISAVTGCSSTEICQDEIRERAYSLWEQAGYPAGDGVDFWVQAEQELKDRYLQ